MPFESNCPLIGYSVQLSLGHKIIKEFFSVPIAGANYPWHLEKIDRTCSLSLVNQFDFVDVEVSTQYIWIWMVKATLFSTVFTG
tara:strand:- start:17625 stop:17876 length:252 start_codon:yes stop_codon:yes gene_type:complete